LFCLDQLKVNILFQNIKKNDSERIELNSIDDENKKLSLFFHYLPEKDCLVVSLPEIKFNY